MKKSLIFSLFLLFSFYAHSDVSYTTVETDALLVPDFVEAVSLYAQNEKKSGLSYGVNFWLQAFKARGIDPEFLANRLNKAYVMQNKAQLIQNYRRIQVERYPRVIPKSEVVPIALHAFRFDVKEEYDDVLNDNIYCYFITTHDDVMWGKVTSIYKGLDEGDSFMFDLRDRGLFGPQGEKLLQKNHTLIDFGIVESDGDDVAQLAKISDAIIDLAVVAVGIYNPAIGAIVEQARAETKNLIRLIVELDADDRLAVDTLRFTPDSTMELLKDTTVYEFSRDYRRSTFWTAYDYRLHFRLIR